MPPTLCKTYFCSSRASTIGETILGECLFCLIKAIYEVIKTKASFDSHVRFIINLGRIPPKGRLIIIAMSVEPGAWRYSARATLLTHTHTHFYTSTAPADPCVLVLLLKFKHLAQHCSA